MRALQEKFCCTSLEVPANMMAVVAPEERNLDLQRTVMKWKYVLVEAEQKLWVTSSAI